MIAFVFETKEKDIFMSLSYLNFFKFGLPWGFLVCQIPHSGHESSSAQNLRQQAPQEALYSPVSNRLYQFTFVKHAEPCKWKNAPSP